MIDRNDQEPGSPARRPTQQNGSARELLRAGCSVPASPAPPRRLRDRDESDPERRAVELAQRGRMILDISAADLEASETTFGPFHPTTWYFRNAWNEARRSWERLRAELGTAVLNAALSQPPLVAFTLDLRKDASSSPQVGFIAIAGQTYCTEPVAGTEPAPVQWRLTRLQPPLDDGPYYVCRLADGSTQCDCAEWIYRIAENGNCHKPYCKHLAALAALGWI